MNFIANGLGIVRMLVSTGILIGSGVAMSDGQPEAAIWLALIALWLKTDMKLGVY